MKVRASNVNFQCPECRIPLTFFPGVGASDPTLECCTERCKNKGKVFRIPEVELEEVKSSGDYREGSRSNWDYE